MTQEAREPRYDFQVAREPLAVGPEDHVDVRFSGVLFQWMREMQPQLKDTDSLVDVAILGVQILHQAQGKRIQVGDGPSAPIYNLWK